MNDPDAKYQSYLLRLWQPTSQHGRRATLINVRRPSDTHHFSSLEALFLFLNENDAYQTGEQTVGPGGQQEHSKNHDSKEKTDAIQREEGTSADSSPATDGDAGRNPFDAPAAGRDRSGGE
jgi:hypothetical protein